MAINTENKKTVLSEDASIYSSHKDIPEKEKWKGMDRKGKLKHFKEYYLAPIIIGIIIVGFAGYLIGDAVTKYRDVSFLSVVVNDDLDDDKLTGFNDSFLEYIDGNPKKEKVDISDAYLLSGSNGADSVNAAQSITSYIYAKQLDTIISDKGYFDHYATLGCFADLSTLLTKEQYEKYKDYIYYPEIKEDASLAPAPDDMDTIRPETTYPCGICLKESSVYKDLGGAQTDPVIGIIVTSQRKETAVKFLEFLFP